MINGAHDPEAFVAALTKAGITDEDAREFKDIIVSEEPQSAEEPLGKKAQHWLVNNLKKAADGSWKIGVGVATAVLKEAALRYYGLK